MRIDDDEHDWLTRLIVFIAVLVLVLTYGY